MPNKGEKQTLETYAKEYIDPDPGRKVDRKLQALIIDNIFPWVKGPEVLEMGYGDGLYTSRVVEAFGHSCIVDASRVLLEEAKSKFGKRIETFEALFEEFDPQRKFDTILATYILEHVEDPTHILRRASSWVNHDGHIVIVVPNAGSFHRRVAACMGILERPDQIGPSDIQVGHRRVYTIERMENDIAGAGLSVARRKGLFLKFLPQSMMTESSDDLLKGYMKLSNETPIEYSAVLAYDCIL